MLNSARRIARYIFYCFCFFAIFLSFPALAKTSLLVDPGFVSGYEVMSPQKDVYTNRAQREAIHRESPGASGKPGWRLVQWGSDKSIAGAKPVTVPDGGITWSAEESGGDQVLVYKRVTTGLNYPLPEQPLSRSLVLELNGLAEFTSHYLTSNMEFWPHLLMVQNISSQKLDSYQSMILQLDARLLFDKKNIQAGYQAHLHAARFPMGFLVKNSLTGNSFWLMLVVYDDRYEQSGFSCQKCSDEGLQDCHQPISLLENGRWLCPYDGNRPEFRSAADLKEKKSGTRKMIFRVPTSAFTRDDIRSGKWAHYEVDLMPYIQAGIDAMHDQQSHAAGENPGLSTALKFYNLSLFTMGWEITGLNHAAMEVKNLGFIGY